MARLTEIHRQHLPDRQRRCEKTNYRRQQVLHCPNAHGRHSPRRWWYTNHCSQQVLNCQKCPLPNEYASALVPRPLPRLLPRSELHRCRPPVLPRRRTHDTLRRFVWRCTCEEQGSRLPEQPQSLHRLGSNR
jgi:hypothetical protein